MKLKDINEIKEDGLVVFMPSGIQATLFNEGKKILVKYYNLKEDRYTIKDFKKVMAEGIEVFSDQPTIPQQSVLMEHYNEDVFEAVLEYATEQGKQVVELEDEDAEIIAKYVSDKIGLNVYPEEIIELLDMERSDMEDLEDDMDESVLMESEGPELDTYQFTFIAQTDEDVLVTDVMDGREFELSATSNIDKELLQDELEEQMDMLVAPELCEYTITGTEIVGFKYDEETGEGSFEFNIFYELDSEEFEESILDKLSKKGFIRESLSKQLKENNWQNLGVPYYVTGENGFVEGPFDTYQQAEEFIDSLENPKDYSIIGEEEYENEFNEAYEKVKNPEGQVFKALKDKKKEYITPEFKLEMLNCLDRIAREYPDIKVRQQALTFMDEINMQEYWDTKAVQDFIKKPLEMLNAHVNESLKEEENEDDEICKIVVFGALPTIKEKVIKPHNFINSYEIYTGKKRAYDGVLLYLPEDEADGFEQFLQENNFKYADMDELEESLNEELQYGVEYRNMHDGIHRLLVTDSKEKAEQILAYLKELENPDTTVYDDNEIMDNSYFTWDEINKLADDCFEVDYREIEEGDGNYNGIYVINYNDIKPDIYESLNEDENSMAEEIRRGNKSGQDPKFGNWLLETSLDEKWEQLTNDMKLYLMDGIADFVQQGSLKEQDLLLEIDPMTGLTKEDVQSLEMFDQEEIDYTFSSEDLQLNAYISYEVKTDLDTPKDMEESLDEDSDLGLYIQTTGELYKKHIQDKKDVDWDALVNDGIAMYKEEIENKEFSPEEVEEAKEYLKNYFTESVDEAIYLKKENGEEVGPFENQEAEEQYIKDQNNNGNEEEYEEIIKDENMNVKNEDCYKVYSTIDPDSQPLSFNNWNEVEDHLNKEWGDYKASMAKENAEFGTDEDRDAFMGNFEVAIEPIEIPVEEIPAEGIELEAEPVIEPTEEVCPECGETECVCDKECEDCCPECGKNPCECETEEPTDDLEEDFEDEHIGKSEEEPTEEPEQEETEEEINTPEEAANKVDEIDDALDSLEDFLNTLIGDEELTDEEKAEINALETEEPAEEIEEKNEEFSDNMGMLTDINDLDMPDALADTIDTKEDGSLYRISDLAKELEDVKSTIEQLKNDFKSELTTMLQDLKNDLKLSVNNVETKVQDTKSAVDNLTSEEEDLADIEFDQEEAPVEEEGQEEAPEEAPAEEETEEDMEEAFDEASLKGNPIYENIKTIVNSNTKCNGKISIPTIAEKLREEYGLNTKIGAIYNNVSDICNKTSIKESIIDVYEEKQLLKESMLGKAAKWLGGGLMSRLEQQKVQAQYENLEAVKQQIDKELQGGADAEQLKDTITLASEDENEEKQAKEYAIQKLQQKTPTTESILSKLKATTKTAQLRDLNIRG